MSIIKALVKAAVGCLNYSKPSRTVQATEDMKTQRQNNDNTFTTLLELQKIAPSSAAMLSVISQNEDIDADDIIQQILSRNTQNLDAILVVSVFILTYFDLMAKGNPMDAFQLAQDITAEVTPATAELLRKIFISGNTSFLTLVQNLKGAAIDSAENLHEVLQQMMATGFM